MSKQNLPGPMKTSEETLLKTEATARLIPELIWQQEISRALNAVVNEEAFEKAEKVVEYVQEQVSSPLVDYKLSRSHNKVVHGEWVGSKCFVDWRREGADVVGCFLRPMA